MNSSNPGDLIMRRLLHVSIAVCESVLCAAFVAPVTAADNPQPKAEQSAEGPASDHAHRSKITSSAFSQRMTYTLQFGSPKKLADVLGQHFQGDAEFRTLTEPESRELLIAARPEAMDDILRTLKQLDKAPRKILVDVWIIDEEVSRNQGESGDPPEKLLDERQLLGPVAEVTERFDRLAKTNSLAYYRQLQLENLEHRENMIQVGEEKPRISGVMMAGPGRFQPMIQQRAVGTIVTVTARLVEGHRILLDLVLRDDRLGSLEDGQELAEGADGPIISQNVHSTNFKANLILPAGQVVLVQRVDTDQNLKRLRRQIAVAARPIEPAAATDKH